MITPRHGVRDRSGKRQKPFYLTAQEYRAVIAFARITLGMAGK